MNKNPKEIKLEPDILKLLFPTKNKKILSKLRITDIGLYSITPPEQAEFICKLLLNFFTKKELKKMTVTDAGAGMGGQVYSLIKYFKKVNIVEISSLHMEIIKHNLKLLFPKKRNYVTINKNYISIMNQLDQDIIFLDPPWGGTDYKKKKDLEIFYERNGKKYNIEDLVSGKSPLIYKKNIKMFIIKLPTNYDLSKIIIDYDLSKIIIDYDLSKIIIDYDLSKIDNNLSEINYNLSKNINKQNSFVYSKVIPIKNKYKTIYNILILSRIKPKNKIVLKEKIFSYLPLKKFIKN